MLLRILDVDGRLVDDGREVLDLGVALLQRVLLLLLLLVAATELILLRALRDLTGIYFHSSFFRSARGVPGLQGMNAKQIL